MIRRIGLGLAVIFGTCLVFASSADARIYRHAHALTVTPVYLPAHLRPDYVGAPGYPGGPPGPRVPGLVDFGFVRSVPTMVGLEVVPPRTFVGVPVLGDLGL